MSESTNYSQLIKDFMDRESLPETYERDAEHWFVPIAELCLDLVDSVPELPVCIGINGCQGSGKSTLSALLKSLVGKAGKSVVVLSIDDFYLGSAERQRLASNIYPLLQTRGVPGTHDIGFALDCVEKLRRLGKGQELALPCFDKSLDNPFPKAQWPRVHGPVDLIIFEGWFMGAAPQPAADLHSPVNDLEANEDSDGGWRNWVNEQLGGDYQALFRQMDLLIMLQAPGFESVYGWRMQQEEKLRRRLGGDGESRLMDEQQLGRFIQHYERLTRHCLATLPAVADIVLVLDEQQRVIERIDRDFSVTE